MKFHVHGAGAHVGFARGYALFNMSVYQTFVNESVMMMLWPMQMQGVIPGQILDEGQLDDFLGRFGMHGTTGQPQCGGDEQHLFHARHDFPLFQFFTILNPLVPQSCARVLRTANVLQTAVLRTAETAPIKKPGACPGEFRKSGGDLQQSFGAVRKLLAKSVSGCTDGQIEPIKQIHRAVIALGPLHTGADVEVGKNGPTIFAVVGVAHKGGTTTFRCLSD